MDPNQVLVAATSLVASLIGAFIAFWAQASHWRRTRKAQALDDEINAIHQLLVKAQSMDLRAHHLALAAKARGSLDGTILALVGGEGLIKPHETIEAITRDAEDLNSAATKLWLASDPLIVALAREVNDAAADVIAAHTARRRPWVLRWVLDAVFGPSLGDPARIEEARRVLGEKRELLVRHTRTRFGLPELSSAEGASG